LDLLLARKIAAPGRPEDAIGAVAPGVTYLDESFIRRLGIGQRYIDLTIAEETRQLRRQERLFEMGHPPAPLQGRLAILVDDGVATGATAAAAIESVRRRGPSRVVFATPVCSPEAHAFLKPRADELICLVIPTEFTAVSEYYDDFTPITNAEILAFLAT
jgi:predicted phosphoribosyltransferase